MKKNKKNGVIWSDLITTLSNIMSPTCIEYSTPKEEYVPTEKWTTIASVPETKSTHVWVVAAEEYSNRLAQVSFYILGVYKTRKEARTVKQSDLLEFGFKSSKEAREDKYYSVKYKIQKMEIGKRATL